MRWLRPPPTCTAYFSNSRRPGVVLRVSDTRGAGAGDRVHVRGASASRCPTAAAAGSAPPARRSGSARPGPRRRPARCRPSPRRHPARAIRHGNRRVQSRGTPPSRSEARPRRTPVAPPSSRARARGRGTTRSRGDVAAADVLRQEPPDFVAIDDAASSRGVAAQVERVTGHGDAPRQSRLSCQHAVERHAAPARAGPRAA